MPAHRTPKGLRLKLGGDLREADPAIDAKIGGLGLDWTTVPPVLDEAGRGAWEHLRVTFADDPVRFREGDRHVITAFCMAVALHDRAAGELLTHGLRVAGRSAPDRSREVKNPAWQLWREAATQVRYLARELALSPASRATAGITDADPERDDADNPFAG